LIINLVSISLVFLNYRREKYPEAEARNQLKLEIRADFLMKQKTN